MGEVLNGLSLFSGIGGLDLAIGEWVRPVLYCENERYAQGVLLSRMADGTLPKAPIWDDIRTFDGRSWDGRVDIVSGGFPCQDISFAGTRKGLEGSRSGLFFQILRLVTEMSPTFVFLENTPGIRTCGAERVGKELASRGYDCRWGVVSAEEVGAPHLRKRWFMLAAHPNGEGQLQQSETIAKKRGRVTDSFSKDGEWWATEPDVGRVVYGLPNQFYRIKCLGNAVVPLQAREAFKRLMGLEGKP